MTRDYGILMLTNITSKLLVESARAIYSSYTNDPREFITNSVTNGLVTLPDGSISWMINLPPGYEKYKTEAQDGGLLVTLCKKDDGGSA